MKKLCFVMLIFCVLFFALQPAWGQDNYVEFTLKGFEIAKGNNIDEETRVGARFMGSVINFNGNEIGLFSTVLDFKGYNNIEVCGGTNDIISLRMTILFTSGNYAWRTMVLKMEDASSKDVFWDFDTSENCGIGGMGCNCPPTDLFDCDLDGDETSLIASVGGDLNSGEGIHLIPTWGSSLIFLRWVESASLSGYLCHHYPFIPRVSGTIRFELR
ncbi:MAG: hypothetical protein ACMUHX_05625 [bacterium]